MRRILILGLATLFICLTLYVQATPVITKEIDDRYSKEIRRDLYLDLKFYYDTYGMGDERLRIVEEIDFALEGSAKDKSTKYSSYERSMSYHYIFARDPTAREIIIITPISETTNITTINLWWLKNSAPFGVLPGSITFYPHRTEIATFEEKVKLNEVKVYKYSIPTTSPLPTLTPTLTPSPTPTPLPTPILTPTPTPLPLLEIETPNWNINDTEAMKLRREGKDKKIMVSEITSHAPPPFYEGRVPFTYKVGYEEITPFFPPARIIVYYDFYKGFQNYFIYEYGNDTLFPTPDGVITLDDLGNKLAEARAVGIGTYDIAYADGTYKTENFLKIEEFHYKNGRLIFYCKSLISIGIHGDKIAEMESLGKKDKEYYFMYPVVPS